MYTHSDLFAKVIIKMDLIYMGGQNMMHKLFCFMKKCSKLTLALLVVSTLLPVSILHAQDQDSLKMTHQYHEENIQQQDHTLLIPWESTIKASDPFTLSDYEVHMEQTTLTQAAAQLQVTTERALQKGIDYEVEYYQQGQWLSEASSQQNQSSGIRIHFLQSQTAKQLSIQFISQMDVEQSVTATTTAAFASQQSTAAYHFVTEQPAVPMDLQTMAAASDTLESIGGSYDIGYILQNYNVFALGNYKGTHVVGPMIVMNEASGYSGANLAVGGSTTSADPALIAHKVPSYFKGKANLSNGVLANSDVNLYLGTANKGSNITVTDAKQQAHSDRVYYTDQFITDSGLASIKAQVKHYMDYDGNDALGNPIKKVNITNAIIQKVLASDYTMEAPYQSEDGSYQMYRVDAKVSENTSVKKVVVELQLGHNFEFDSLDQVQTLVYDYADTDEAVTTTTFIGTKQSGVVNLPRIMKTVADEFGMDPGDGGYQFNSLEASKGINVVYFMNETVTKVNIGAIESNGSLYSDGQRKLIGHMVAPSADVVVHHSDYNGCIIGKNITANSEGHMWPFKLDAGISFYKLVNDHKPDADELFDFQLHNMAHGNDHSKDQLAQNNANGLVSFQLKDLNSAGIYTFQISEVPKTGYTDLTKALYVKVEVSISHGVAGDVLVPKVKGYYTKWNGTAVDESSKITDKVTYRNQRDFTVKKVWEDSAGNPLNTAGLPEVNVELWRSGVQADGHQIIYNIYMKTQTTDYAKVTTKRLRSADGALLYVKDGAAYKSQVNLADRNVRLDESYTKMKNPGLVTQDTQGISTTFTLNQIKTDQEINVYYTNYGTAAASEKLFAFDWLLTTAENKQAIMSNVKTINEKLETFQLNEGNQWTKSFPNLLATGEVDGINYKFTYSVKETSVPGYRTKIDNNNITGGVITIHNILIPTTQLNIQKVSSTGNNNALANAKFELLDSKLKPLMFQNKDGTWQLDASAKTSTMVSDANGMIHITQLPYGDYVLRETAPPNGFAIKEEYSFLHIDSNPKNSYICHGSKVSTDQKQPFQQTTDPSTNELINSLTVENIPDLKMPQTGGIPKKNGYQKEGILLIAMGIVSLGILYGKRKTEKRGR